MNDTLPTQRPRLSTAEMVAYFEKLAPNDLRRIAEIYCPDARFKDPFNEVTGVDAIAGIFAHMFARLDVPRFIVNDALAQGDQAFLTWAFQFRFRGDARMQTIHGASHLQLARDGRILVHRDYWDAAEELYEKLPLIGWFMRCLKRAAAA